MAKRVVQKNFRFSIEEDLLLRKLSNQLDEDFTRVIIIALEELENKLNGDEK